jgi:hypothetical protein
MSTLAPHASTIPFRQLRVGLARQRRIDKERPGYLTGRCPCCGKRFEVYETKDGGTEYGCAGGCTLEAALARLGLDEPPHPPTSTIPVPAQTSTLPTTEESGTTPKPSPTARDAIATAFPVDAPRSLQARYWVEHGFALTPIPPGLKGSTQMDWNKEGHYFTDPAEAELYWQAHPNDGMGTVHAGGGTCALDLDHPEAARVLAMVGVDIQRVTEAASLVVMGHPEHPPKPFFEVPIGVSLTPRKLTWPNLTPGEKPITIFELRAGPVQDVLPPTIHPETGKPYRLVRGPNGSGLSPLPAELLALWRNWDALLPKMKAACAWATTDPGRPTTRESTGEWDSVRHEVLGRYTLAEALSEAGITLDGNRGLCPFHKETHPSFWTFTGEDGIERWCCAHGGAPVGVATSKDFSVGDSIDLYAFKHGLAPGKALSELARRYGITVPGQNAGSSHACRGPGNHGPSPWPEAPAPEVFYGPVGDFARFVEPLSEADPIAIVGQTLAFLGNVIGRGPYFAVGADHHYTNIYIVLIGKTSGGRKGTSLGYPRKLFETVEPAWALGRVKSGLSSGEGLKWAVRDPISQWQAPKKSKDAPDPLGEWVQTDPGENDKRLLVLQPEFASALKVAKREGNTLSTVIRELWDTGNVATLTKNDPVTATNAHVSIIGHITRDELRRELTATETLNGFANRYLWVCVQRSKCLPEAPEVPSASLASFADTFSRIIRFSRTVGQMTRDAGAPEMWAAVYPELTREEDGLYGAAIARGAPQVLRLSMLYALTDCSAVIREEHLLAALAFWTYADQSAKYVFRYSQGNPIADQMLQAVGASLEGLSRSSVYDLFGRHVTRGEIDAALASLQEKGLIRIERRSTAGRPAEWIVSAGGCERSEVSEERGRM